MSDYDQTNTFVLFINDRKTDDKAADRTGTLNVNGVEYYMDGWIKQGKKGPFLSGRIKPKKQTAGAQQNRTATIAHTNDIDSDIPF